MLLANGVVENETETAVLTCSFVGIPKPNILWKYSNSFGDNSFSNNIMPSRRFNITTITTISNQGLYMVNTTLQIKNLTRDEERQYQCSAVNNVTNLLNVRSSSSTPLTVQCKQ